MDPPSGVASTKPTLTQATISTAKEAVAATNQTIDHVLHWRDLPAWTQIDPYIRRGYRRPLGTFVCCFQSLFYLHNESVNTWSHLLPACGYVAWLFLADWPTFWNSRDGIVWTDAAVVRVYVVGTAGCLFLSVSSAHSNTVSAHIDV